MELGVSPLQLDVKDFEDLPHLQDCINSKSKPHIIPAFLPLPSTFSEQDILNYLHTGSQSNRKEHQ